MKRPEIFNRISERLKEYHSAECAPDCTVGFDLPSILSKREMEVMKLQAWGDIQKEIADKLFIAPSTVTTHLQNIRQKLNVHKETDIARVWIFYEYGIADNPFKKVCAILCLAVMLSTFATHALGFRINNRAISEVREVREVRTGRTLNLRFNRLKVA